MPDTEKGAPARKRAGALLMADRVFCFTMGETREEDYSALST